MVRFEYIPEKTEDDNFMVPIKFEIGLTGEASINDYFTAWKAFMTSLTFNMENFSLVREGDDETI